ncbi:MAG: hypothetical protein QOH53_2184 [Ilumatobacteraceae bacterium]
MHFAAILLILGGLLSGLIFVAVVQRRSSDAMAGPPGFYVSSSQSAFEGTQGPTEYDKPTWALISITRIAVGVWLGLWLFVFTAAIPAFIIVTRLAKSGS